MQLSQPAEQMGYWKSQGSGDNQPDWTGAQRPKGPAQAHMGGLDR